MRFLILLVYVLFLMSSCSKSHNDLVLRLILLEANEANNSDCEKAKYALRNIYKCSDSSSFKFSKIDVELILKSEKCFRGLSKKQYIEEYPSYSKLYDMEIEYQFSLKCQKGLENSIIILSMFKNDEFSGFEVVDNRSINR